MFDNNGKIGVFDSGIGGLTVLKEVLNELPNENIIYFGDGKRTPYGGKSKQTIEKFALQNMRFLLDKGAKAVIIACNTVSSNAMDAIREKFDIPVIEVITTTANLAAEKSQNRNIGVIGTRATIESGTYISALNTIDSNICVSSKCCPLFVPLAEEGPLWWKDEITKMVASRYFKVFEGKNLDTLILGCTHYPLLGDVIQEVIGKDVVLVDSAKITAIKAKEVLKDKGLLNNNENKGSLEIYTSDSVERFMPMCNAILGRNSINIQRADVGE